MQLTAQSIQLLNLHLGDCKTEYEKTRYHS